MGSDLCGYIVCGPLKLSKVKIREAKNLLTLLKNKATAALAQPPNKDALRDFLILLGQSNKRAVMNAHQYIELRAKFDEDEEGEQAQWLSQCNPNNFIDEFVAAWGKEGWRDQMSRLMPGNPKKQILACGERTCGDGPEEPGMWFSCQKLDELGLLGVLGLD